MCMSPPQVAVSVLWLTAVAALEASTQPAPNLPTPGSYAKSGVSAHAPKGVGQGCAFCTSCGGLGKIGNIAWDPMAPLAINEVGAGLHPDECFLTGNCAAQHPETCGPATQAAAVVEAAAAAVDAYLAGDALAAYRVVRSRPENGRLYFSVARFAIQMRGCDDSISLHLPLTALVTAQLLNEIASDHATAPAGSFSRLGAALRSGDEPARD